MLFTRCPDCQTTFRVTNELLHKADGQVRCGRCTNIFNAYAYLRERLETPPLEPRQRASDAAPGSLTPATAAGPPPAVESPVSAPRAAGLAPQIASEGEPPPGAAERAAAVPAGAAGANAAISSDADAVLREERVNAVLADTVPKLRAPSSWYLETAAPEPMHRAVWWRVAAAAAAFLLALQLLHHFSGALATRHVVGPIVASVYSLLGIDIVPDWNVEQYEVVDWVAQAQPETDGRSTLVITASIRNRGPRAQPYPHVQLQLLDRWEKAVGRRVFEPDEYLALPSPPDSMMQPGDTAQAQLVIVDPGPDAYGFELDVCVGTKARLDCTGGRVFR